MAELDPGWKPDLARGRRLLDAGLIKHKRSWAWPVLATAAAVCATVVALPQTRVLAQQLWVHYILNRIDVVRLDLSDLPLRAEVTGSGPPQTARDLDDAERKAGFRPYLPEPGVLPPNPSITVIGAMLAEQTIHVAELQAALNKAGASGVAVPASWEGVQLRAHIGPMVNLAYPDEVGILEARPIELSIPAGFSLQYFAELAFRSLGQSVREARSLAQKFVTNPAWMMGIPADEVANVEQVALAKGPAMLRGNQ